MRDYFRSPNVRRDDGSLFDPSIRYTQPLEHQIFSSTLDHANRCVDGSCRARMIIPHFRIPESSGF